MPHHVKEAFKMGDNPGPTLRAAPRDATLTREPEPYTTPRPEWYVGPRPPGFFENAFGETVGGPLDWIRSRFVRKLNKNPAIQLTVGEVKRRINLWLAIRGAENREDTIFAIGADAGVPHSAGISEDRIEIGKSIIFDIFPAEFGGGYCYDMTRTWCLDHATDEVQQIYEDVLDVYEKASAALKPNELCRDIQILTCELFEEKGHPTIMSNPKTLEGYVHA